MKKIEWDGQKVTVLGFGKSGQSAAALLVRLGAAVFVSEKRSRSQLPPQDFDELIRYPHELGGHTDAALKADKIILSPGIPSTIQILKDFDGEVWSEIELACRVMDATIVGVTGSNGKTTTVTLLGEILSKHHSKGQTYVVGNIGTPVSHIALQVKKEDVVVIELSSFQLETIQDFRPNIAVWLNLNPNHLDRYSSIEEYKAAKQRIFMNMTSEDTAIINCCDESGSEMADSLSGIKVKRLTADAVREELKALGDDALREIKAPENLISALYVSDLLGVARAKSEEAVKQFRSLPHRIEKIGELDGVAFYNDSKATNVAAVRVALDRFSDNVILLLGGKDKGEDYSKLSDLIEKKCRFVIAYGQAASLIAGPISCDVVADLESAVNKAAKKASKGDSILLSPACSSYDQFKNFEERGETFKSLFADLKREQEILTS